MTTRATLALALSCALLAGARASAQDLFVHVREAQDRGARSLSVQLESRRLYACNPPLMPVTLRSAEPSIVIEVGRVRERRTRVEPCSGRMPAAGSVVLPTPAPGRYPLIIRRERREDRYALVVTEDALRLEEVRVGFSRRRGPESLARVPLDAVLVICTYGVNRDDCPAAPALSCQDLYADAHLTSLAALPRAAPYATPTWDADFPRYRAPDAAAIGARVRARYRDPRACLRVDVLSGRGDHFTNL